MKSASRAGSAMLIASVCRSSDMSGDSDTICWKFALMLRCSASISQAIGLVETLARLDDARAQEGLRLHDLLRRTRARPCTMIRRLPSGSLNILWMCDATPIGYRSRC